MSSYLFTSESVKAGHPDKVADQISDAILDAALEQDPQSRVACEVMLAGKTCVIAGEITTTAVLDYEAIARKTICDIGYDRDGIGLNGNTVEVIVRVGQQSPEIASGVFAAEQGAGDQGIVFGYATADNHDYFPVAGMLAHRIAASLEDLELCGVLPDGKTQVTIEYCEDGSLLLDTVVVSVQHDTSTTAQKLQGVIKETITEMVGYYNDCYALPGREVIIHRGTRFLINPAGDWNIGGSESDAGLTGRKIIVDSYCGYARHGGGAFSGKDPSKTDRSGAYAARKIARAIVEGGYAKTAEVQIGYAIGVANPVSIRIESEDNRRWPSDHLENAVLELCQKRAPGFDLTPAGIEKNLRLRSGEFKYLDTARYCHFTGGFPWEQVDDAIESLKTLLG